MRRWNYSDKVVENVWLDIIRGLDLAEIASDYQVGLYFVYKMRNEGAVTMHVFGMPAPLVCETFKIHKGLNGLLHQYGIEPAGNGSYTTEYKADVVGRLAMGTERLKDITQWQDFEPGDVREWAEDPHVTDAVCRRFRMKHGELEARLIEKISRRYDANTKAGALEEYLGGESINHIAHAHRCSPEKVSDWLRYKRAIMRYAQAHGLGEREVERLMDERSAEQ